MVNISVMQDYQVPEPFRFNPLKHHLLWIKEFVNNVPENNAPLILKQIRHIGSSVMDVYQGTLEIKDIIEELKSILSTESLLDATIFSEWAGTGYSDFRLVKLTDGSQWTIKYHPDKKRFIHFFPSRNSSGCFRVKANTLKSAILYIIIIGKDYIIEEDLNRARAIAGLSPVKEIAETEAISEMIEILRN